MKRRTKGQRVKDFREKMRRRAINGWKVRRLRMEANPREETFEEIVERAKQDRKGAYYATLSREGVTIKMFHSLNRSDQFDIDLTTQGNFKTLTKRIINLSAPKVYALFQNPV